LWYDIAIVGAGPAGSVLAFLAARAGLRVLVAERSRFDRPRIGETAPPELRPLLARLDLGHILHRTSREVPAVVSVWGSFAAAERHHIFSPYGDGVHLDRRAFDEGLARAASGAGADIRIGRSARFSSLSGGGYAVCLRGGETVEARLAVLACGRASTATEMTGTRCYLDDQIAVAARFVCRSGQEPRTIVEAIPGGWFYLAAMPDERMIAVFMTQAGAVPSDPAARRRWWLEALARTTVVRTALAGQPIPTCLSVHDARASYARTSAGKDWLAIGDARLAPDPLSGQGIIWAVEDALFANQLLGAGSQVDLAEALAARTSIDVADYQAERQRIYAMERRFPNDAYWSQRGVTARQPISV
jgi:flavin-dependent dehydrogenase